MGAAFQLESDRSCCSRQTPTCYFLRSDHPLKENTHYSLLSLALAEFWYGKQLFQRWGERERVENPLIWVSTGKLSLSPGFQWKVVQLHIPDSAERAACTLSQHQNISASIEKQHSKKFSTSQEQHSRLSHKHLLSLWKEISWEMMIWMNDILYFYNLIS